MQNKREREQAGRAASRSIFQLRIISCFTDLSLNNSCRATASTALGWDGDQGTNREGRKKRRHLGGEVTCDGAWSSRGCCGEREETLGRSVSLVMDNKSPVMAVLVAALDRHFAIFPIYFSLSLYLIHSASLSFTQNSIYIMFLSGNGLTSVFIGAQSKSEHFSMTVSGVLCKIFDVWLMDTYCYFKSWASFSVQWKTKVTLFEYMFIYKIYRDILF